MNLVELVKRVTEGRIEIRVLRLFLDHFNRRNIVVNLAVCADDDRSAAAGMSLAPKLKVKVRIEQQLVLVSVWCFVHINVRSATSVLN